MLSDNTADEWIVEAEARLQKIYDLIRCSGGQSVTSKLVIKPPLDASEAEYFVRGLDTRIFSIDDGGYVQSTVLPLSKKSKKNKVLCLFWRRENEFGLFREGVCQVSTLAALKLKYGCPLDQIQMEPTFPTLPALNWAVDMLLKSPQGINTAVCEVKKNNCELDRLIEGFQYCCKEGSHLKDECKFKKNHAKYALCKEIKPEYFITVSPGREICWHLSYDGDFISTTEAPLSSLMDKLQKAV